LTRRTKHAIAGILVLDWCYNALVVALGYGWVSDLLMLAALPPAIVWVLSRSGVPRIGRAAMAVVAFGQAGLVVFSVVEALAIPVFAIALGIAILATWALLGREQTGDGQLRIRTS
jgi:hypothetical protein